MGLTVRRVSALLLGTGVLLVAVGLIASLIPLELARQDAPGWAIGAAGAAYYAGLVVGGLRVGRWLRGVGHVRVYAALTSLLASTVLVMALAPVPGVWTVGRGVMGLVMGGIYVIIESWLNAASPPAQRGRLLALYQLTVYGGLAVGQLGLSLPDTTGGVRLTGAALLVCLAVVPVALTTEPVPEIVVPPRMDVSGLASVASLALLGAAVAGGVSGVVMGIGPAVGLAGGQDAAWVAGALAAFFAAGAASQLPVGALSDRLDRRLVIAGCGLLSAAACGVPFVTPDPWWWMVAVALLGAAAMPLYAVVMAYAFDRVAPGAEMEASTALFLAFCMGSMAGAFGGAVVLDHEGPGVLLGLLAGCGGLLALAAIGRALTRDAVPEADKVDTLAAPRTSAAGLGLLDPRVDEDTVDAPKTP